MSDEQYKKCGDHAGFDPHKVDFSTFVLSLGTSVMMHLGQGPTEAGMEVSLPLARQMIDIIAMLKDKTQGNLDENEQHLIDTFCSICASNILTSARQHPKQLKKRLGVTNVQRSTLF